MIIVKFKHKDGNDILTFTHPILYRKSGKCNILADNIPFFDKTWVFDFYTREIHILLTGLCSKTEKTTIESIIHTPESYDGDLSLQIETEDGSHVYEKYDNSMCWFTSCNFNHVEGISLYNFSMDLLLGESY